MNARASFTETSAAYERHLASALAPFRTPLLAPNNFGVDYYGIRTLQEIVGSLPRSADVLALMYADALVDAAIHDRRDARLEGVRAQRPVCILNGYCLQIRAANITRRHPQAILGLRQHWTHEERQALRALVSEHLLNLVGHADPPVEQGIAMEFLAAVAADADLQALEFRTLGLDILSLAYDRPHVVGILDAAARLGHSTG